MIWIRTLSPYFLAMKRLKNCREDTIKCTLSIGQLVLSLRNHTTLRWRCFWLGLLEIPIYFTSYLPFICACIWVSHSLWFSLCQCSPSVFVFFKLYWNLPFPRVHVIIHGIIITLHKTSSLLFPFCLMLNFASSSAF